MFLLQRLLTGLAAKQNQFKSRANRHLLAAILALLSVLLAARLGAFRAARLNALHVASRRSVDSRFRVCRLGTSPCDL